MLQTKNGVNGCCDGRGSRTVGSYRSKVSERVRPFGDRHVAVLVAMW